MAEERPILFSGPMVAAILSGRKTQTRRVVAPQPHPGISSFFRILPGSDWWKPAWGGPNWRPGEETIRDNRNLRCPFGRPGDRLWCREAHAIVPATAYRCSGDVPHRVSPCGDWWAVYRAGWERSAPGRWRPSIHMPRWASRLTLEICDVRVERLQAITEDDARVEGVTPEVIDDRCPPSHLNAFVNLWTQINGRREGCSWGSNCWVWALTFRRCGDA